MNSEGPHPIGTYELPMPTRDQRDPLNLEKVKVRSFPGPMLVKNVVWFCRLRWLAVGFLTAFWVSGVADVGLGRFGMHGTHQWALLAAAALMMGNVVLQLHTRTMSRMSVPRGAKANLWAQITLDLLILTVIVHFVGSTMTAMPFTYLFHVVLACIFFSRRESLAVMLLACTLYAACIMAEQAALIPMTTIFDDPLLQNRTGLSHGLASINF